MIQWLLSKIPLKSVVVWFDCPNCDNEVEWCLNDTEVLLEGSLANVCPKCGKSAIIHFEVAG